MNTLDLEIAKDIDQIRIIPLFNEVVEEELKSIFSKMEFVWIDENNRVVDQGENLKSVFFVIRGLVQACYTSFGGKVVFMQEFGPGRMFGEVAAFDSHMAMASFDTLKKSFIGTISCSDYRDICIHNPLIANAAFHESAMRTRSLIIHLAEMTTLGVNNRIHAELLRRGRQGSISGSRAEINPVPTHANIAFRVNTQRELVTRELNRLEETGILHKTRSKLVIVSMDRLESLVENFMGNQRVN